MSKVCLDAGHSISIPGASGNGIKEEEVTLKIALKVGSLLEKNGVEVIYTRKDERALGRSSSSCLGKRCQIANAAKVDYFISIHINSADNTSARGIETLYNTRYGTSVELANAVQNQILVSTKMNSRGLKLRRDLYVLNETKMPACLVEVGFLSNTKDAALLKKEAFLQKCANGIAGGICQVIGVSYEENAVSTSEEEIFVNGFPLKYNTIIEKGVTYVPLRSMAEQLGAAVHYDQGKVYIDQKQVSQKTILIDATTYIALRDLGELIGASVSYDEKTKKKSIDKA